MSSQVSFNWVGLTVTNLERSRRFYEGLLGFEYQRQLRPPDQGTSVVCQVESPTNLTAVYLTLDGFVLELLHWEREGNPGAQHHPMNQPGLTHLSVNVPDLRSLVDRVPEFGGTVLAQTDLKSAICITDPDGQVIELLSS
jgi:predicted enzyme related to lactoylglutathione lyase